MNLYKTYLGDGAYVELSDVELGGVWLTTSDGIEDTNAIYLEPSVLAALLEYVAKIPEMEHDRAVAHAEMVEDRRREGYNEQ
jgi:hypothetical protein